MSELLGAAKGPAGDLIKDGTIETFEADVLRASMETPVIVDFWATWCGPCKQLTPRLEKAVADARGRVRLVKIDIDKNQMLAGQMRIQSVPTVYAFFQGRPVDGFQGALPDSEIKAFVSRLTALAGDDGLGDVEELLDAAEAAFNEGDVAGAAEMYGRIAESDGGNPRALAGLARCHVAMKDFGRARTILDMIPEEKRNDAAVTSVRAALDLAENEKPVADVSALARKVEQNPGDLAGRFELAGAYVAAGNMEAAIDELLEIVARDRAWNDEAARKKLLTIFDALGFAHPASVRGRRRLSSILFS